MFYYVCKCTLGPSTHVAVRLCSLCYGIFCEEKIDHDFCNRCVHVGLEFAFTGETRGLKSEDQDQEPGKLMKAWSAVRHYIVKELLDHHMVEVLEAFYTYL